MTPNYREILRLAKLSYGQRSIAVSAGCAGSTVQHAREQAQSNQHTLEELLALSDKGNNKPCFQCHPFPLCTKLVDVLAVGGATEEETVPAAGCPVLRLVAGFEQAGKDAQYTSPSLKMGIIRKAPADFSADALSSNSLLAKTIVAALVLVNIQTVLG